MSGRIPGDCKVDDVEPGKDACEDCPKDRTIAVPRTNYRQGRTNPDSGLRVGRQPVGWMNTLETGFPRILQAAPYKQFKGDDIRSIRQVKAWFFAGLSAALGNSPGSRGCQLP